MPAPNRIPTIEINTGVARLQRLSTEQKRAAVAETIQLGMSISHVNRRHELPSCFSDPV